ncbi:LacI family DNA-binding transcriptional regulator [Priestia aryabhattai]|uniref:LacI family DNA-binding transcriptional regulator n=1 Tax=Priestia aryabhattai TaxID=412384 RepID=A0ABD7X3S5_PRIAR|nr:LacI family DNA-binding transcriptional regulator [Priestia aryabhattai]WEA47168.1 LacI family DNA-binding transcriptional regulator [Priestia aryabhattai]
MATMKDISKKANVSLSTVSAVINQSAYVSPGLTNRVMQAIEELNYKPNAVARSLKKKRTNTVGVIVSNLSNPFYPPLIEGIEDVSFNNNFNVILCNVSNGNKKILTYLELMLEKQVDGLLLANIANSEDLNEVEKTGLKYVLINRKPPFYDKNFVGVNNPLSSELAVNHLVRQGYKRIAFFGGDLDINTARERKAGFISCMTQTGLDIDPMLIYDGEYSLESGYTNVKKMIEQVEVLPEAICTASDIIAFGVIKGLRDSGIRVPEDISVIGNDNNSFSENFLVPLSSIDHSTYDMGKLSMEFLLEMIKEKDETRARQIILTPSLVVRESCGYKRNKIDNLY